MTKRMQVIVMAALLAGSAAAWAKLPPPPPEDPAKKAAADEKKKAAADKEKAELNAAEDRAVKNYQENMKKAGKPVPKPVQTAATSAPPKGGEKKPQANTAKTNAKK